MRCVHQAPGKPSAIVFVVLPSCRASFDMRKAYYTLDITEAVLLKDHLVHNGVAASVMNKGVVRIPYDGVASEVWVADDAEADEVKTLIRGFLRQRKEALMPAATSWRCQNCREENPGEFEFCWSCGQTPTEPIALTAS